MTVTDKLVRVFMVDKQIRGLRGRLRAAERFLDEQVRQLAETEQKKKAIEAQLRQLTASAANEEGEIKRLDERVTELRERMNSAKTNKEYKALLTEVNTFKDDRSQREDNVLAQMEKVDALKTQLAELEAAHAERAKMRDVAETDRAKRAEEIKDRLEELERERAALVSDVPREAVSIYEELVGQRDDEAMAPIEIQDRRRHEFTCGSCMMSLPVEAMSALLGHGSLTRCVSCGCILYVETSVRDAMTPSSKR